MKDFKNWMEISKGYYRYVISSNVAYEIFIEYLDHNTPIKPAKASLCFVKTSLCLVENWYRNRVSMTEREWLGKELPLQELLDIAYKDNKEKNK